MARNNNIRTLYVGIHLGGAPSFDIRADEDAAATPIDCKFSGDGIGPADRDFLLEIVNKIVGAYANLPTLSLCVDGAQIERDSECP